MKIRQILIYAFKVIATLTLIAIVPAALLLAMAGESIRNHYEWWEFVLLIGFKLLMLSAAVISGHAIVWIWTGKWKHDQGTSA